MPKETDYKAIEERSGSLCLQYCRAACCRNVNFERLPADQFAKFTAKADTLIPVKTFSQVLDSVYESANNPEGIYYSVSDGTYSIGIRGACPNLQADNSCGIYENRPEPCRNFETGGKQCDNARRKEGLKPLAKSIPEANQPTSFSKKVLGKLHF